MCAIAYSADGTLTSAPKGDFEADPKYQAIYRDGRPDYFVERSGSTTVFTEVTVNELNKANGVVALTTGEQVEGKKSTGLCPYCSKSTHLESRCFDKFPHLAPKRLQERMASLAGTKPAATANTADARAKAVVTTV